MGEEEWAPFLMLLQTGDYGRHLIMFGEEEFEITYTHTQTLKIKEWTEVNRSSISTA